jgi:hypothetical protein
MSTAHRQPSMPNGAIGTKRYERYVTIGKATKPTARENAKARPRRCFGTNSDKNALIVTISTPIPAPAIKRQRFRPKASF